MRRTHVMHARDNRRPHYFANRDHRDQRPEIRWIRNGCDQQVLEVGGQSIAEVFPSGEPDVEYVGWERKVIRHPHTARIVAPGARYHEERIFDDCDAARAWCEAAAAELVAVPA